MNKQDRLSKMLENLEKNTSGSNIFLKVTEEGMKIRQVPYPHDEDNLPYLSVYYHYNIGKNKYICPFENFGDTCPLCELAEKIRTSGEENSWQLYNKIKAKPRYFSPVLVRGKEEDGVKLWAYGVTVFKDLLSKENDEDWGSLFDIENGHDIFVKLIPKGKSGNDTAFNIVSHDVKPITSNLIGKGLTQKKLKEIISEIPNYLELEEFSAKSYRELTEVVQNLGDTSETQENETSWSNRSEEEDEETNNTSPSSESSKKEKALSKLDEILREE